MNENLTDEPNFICIGFAKTGTTWLHRHLSHTRGVWMPPVKEMNFNWRILCSNVDFLSSSFFLNQIRWRYIYFKIRIRYYLENIKEVRKENIIWDMKYIFYFKSISLYKKLFLRDKSIISGDISPIYSEEIIGLKKEHLIEIKKAFPKVKIIIILRNPVERLWSFSKMMNYKIKLSRNSKTNNDLFHFIKKRINFEINRVSYLKMWKEVFEDENLKFFFYEELSSQPYIFLRNIYEFIGIDINNINKDINLEEKVWEGINIPIPSDIEKELYEVLKNSIQELFDLIPNQYTYQYLCTCNNKLKNKNNH